MSEEDFEFKPKNPRAELVTAPPKGIEPAEFRAVVVAAAAVYSAHGIPPTAQNMLQFGFIAMHHKTIERIMRTDEFAVEMAAKGIIHSDINAALTPQQLLCLEAVTNPARKGTLENRLRQAGVTPSQYKIWKQNPFFAAQLQKLTGNIFAEYQGEMDQALMNQALDGKLDAIRYANELSGRHDPNRVQAINVKAYLDYVVQVIQTFVTDPEMLANIGKALAEYDPKAIDKPRDNLIESYKQGVIDGSVH